MNIVDKHLHITCAYDGMEYHEILFYTNAHDIFLYLRPFLLLHRHLQSGVQSKFAFPHLQFTFAVAID